MANVIDKATGKPLGGAQPTMLLEWGGVRLGLMGEWDAGASVESVWLSLLVCCQQCCWPGAARCWAW